MNTSIGAATLRSSVEHQLAALARWSKVKAIAPISSGNHPPSGFSACSTRNKAIDGEEQRQQRARAQRFHSTD